MHRRSFVTGSATTLALAACGKESNGDPTTAQDAGATEPLFSLGPRQDQLGDGVNMVTGTINPYTDPALGSFSVITLKGADNQATRITGIDAARVTADRSVVLFINLSESGIDCGQVVFKHQDASADAANRIICPAALDYYLPIFGAVFAIYGSDLRWHLVTDNGYAKYVTAQALRLYPNALTPLVGPGIVNNYNPTALSSYAAGEGLAGGDLRFEEYSLIRINTAAGETYLTGLSPNAGTDANVATLGGVKLLLNVGSGTLTIAHLNDASTPGRQFLCPGGVDFTLQPHECAWVISPLGDPNSDSDWHVIAQAKSDCLVSLEPSTTLSGLVDNYAPVGQIGDNVGLSHLQATWLKIAGSASGRLNTMNPGIHGRRIVMTNYGAEFIINHDASGGAGPVTTGKPFLCPGATGYTVAPYQSVGIVYDGQVGVWLVGV